MKTETELDLLEMLLRDQPLCTAAEISNFAIAFWDGRRLSWARLTKDGSDRADEMFNLDLDAWDELCGYVDDWLASPRYSERPELHRWLQNAQ
ncbi:MULTISPECIES: hypothetical protein [Paraburkholderia]|uniref:Uncharacterized protein n=1 Tax=Paraburkholderia acidicola TaxID=1912599 RepID=A0ABV1LYE8_9BURK